MFEDGVEIGVKQQGNVNIDVVVNDKIKVKILYM